MRAPDIDLTSPASRNLTDDPAVGSTNFPEPVASTLGHVERLLVAADDQMLCVAHLVDKPDPTWFGHLAVIRSSIEALSRVWFLTDPDVTALERARRLANERLSELQHADSLLANQLADLPEELKKQWKDHTREQRARLGAWARERGIPNPGGSLGETRPRPLDLVALIYSGGDEASVGKLLGAWHYSTLSSVAHGLPDGMSQYVRLAAPEGHAHLV